jgi:hypothetical protein
MKIVKIGLVVLGAFCILGVSREITLKPETLPTMQNNSNTLPGESPRVSNSNADRVYFGPFTRNGALNWPTIATGSREYLALPRVKILRDWGTYNTGDVVVVYSQLNNGLNGSGLYRGALEGERLPNTEEGELFGRCFPCEICEYVRPLPTAQEAVRDAREVARHEALRDCRFVKSRGTFLGTFSDKDGPVSPHEPADCHNWSGTNRELRSVVAEVLARHPNVDTVGLAGGFDGSYDGDSFKDFLTGTADYAPWASSWDVEVWSRKDGWKVRI